MANPLQFAYRTQKAIGVFDAAPVYEALPGFVKPEGKAVRVGLGQDKGGKGKGRGREKKIKGTKVTRGGTSRCRVHKSHDLFFSFFCMLIQAVLRGQECHPVGSRPLEAPHKLSLAQAKHSGQGVLARYSPQVQVDFGLWPFTDSVSGLQ